MFLNNNPQLGQFATTVVDWQRKHGRSHLPWQGTQDAYRIWLSEIMLQQTQVSTVIGYYSRFLGRFPTIASLANATQEEVMPYWAGLGYYARARNLHRCAQELVENWNGRFPASAAEIASLPGIGRSTAAAIAAFAYRERAPIMDGNVKRVFARYFGIHGITTQQKTERILWDTAHAALSAAPATLDMPAYTQGLMDLGSDCCARGRPDCMRCPLQATCYAYLNATQDQLPTPKPRKSIPERHCAMLILDNAGLVLLERQASPGIWGGLWSLPKYDDAASLQAACMAWGQAGTPAHRMAGISHVFSHFKLHIEPWHVPCGDPIIAEPGPGQAWVPVAELASTALPAPISKILEGVYAVPNQ
ncbi:MAG TPA: A/G-specific adenine glycosylase [Candidimonas sp.]|nr:A/G-specific adenine glycosylase [Candidimonas sp.]